MRTVENRARPYVRILDRFPEYHFLPVHIPIEARTMNVRVLLSDYKHDVSSENAITRRLEMQGEKCEVCEL